MNKRRSSSSAREGAERVSAPCVPSSLGGGEPHPGEAEPDGTRLSCPELAVYVASPVSPPPTSTSDPWNRITRFDPRGVALYERHYSCRRYADGRKRRQFAPPGQPLCLMTVGADALFGWVNNRVPRLDGQEGVNCFVFRNESAHLASDLIRWAMDRAWIKWPGERLFTYVDPGKVRRKRDPGRCFRKAGWRPCGRSKSGLLIFEVMP